MKKGALFILFCLAAAGCTTQKKWQLKAGAEQAVANKDWYGAEQYYYQLYKLDSGSVKNKFNYAEAARQSFDVDIALKMYGRVAALDNGRKYPMAFYWMGQLLKNKQQYRDAKKWFAKFAALEARGGELPYYKKKAQMEIPACDEAVALIASPLHLQSEHLSEAVNTRLSEYAPFEKDSNLYFSSLRPPDKNSGNQPVYGKIYRADNKKAKLSRAKPLDSLYNNPRLHNANVCFSPGDHYMVVSHCKAKNASDYLCDLYMSAYSGGKWQQPVRLEEPVNLPGFNTTQACFGRTGGKTILFFASNRPGGEGGMDIWYCNMKEDGSFEKPVNAGKRINTAEDELSPWFVSDRDVLFFSSTFHKGLGGFDVFKCRFVKDEFTEPENVGFPINSSYNDIYYSTNGDGSRVYVSSNRTGSLFDGKLNCCNDIYRFNIDTIHTKITEVVKVAPPDSATIVKRQLKLLVPLSLYFHNDEPDPRTKNTTTTKNYEATFKGYMALAETYASVYSKGLKDEEKLLAESAIGAFFADSLKAGMADLEVFCDMLAKILQNGETVKITMKGYCSPLAATDYNINLAKRRVSSLINYFRETKNGWFVKYIDNPDPKEGKIIFEEVDVGELPATNTSDNLNDKRNSVFSPAAAGQRKIQILAVSFVK